MKKYNPTPTFNKVERETLEESKTNDIDMDSLMNSINGASILYKELSRACHPDRFVNTNKQVLADKIFQEISQNRRNYKKLSQLKIRAEKELNINFI